MKAVFQSNAAPQECRNLKRRKLTVEGAEKDLSAPTTLQNSEFGDCELDLLITAELGLPKSGSPSSALHEAFAHQWYLSERDLATRNPCVVPALGETGSEVERRRLDTIRCFWDAARNWKLSLESVEMTYSSWGRLLHHYKSNEGISCKAFALSATTALRMATKFNERLEVIWELPKNPWELLGVFEGWPVDKSGEALLESECASLTVLEGSLDVPSPSKIFDHLLVIGGWPSDMVVDLADLGHYLLALSHFGSGPGHVRESIGPTKLASAALALSVKITNLSRNEDSQYDFFPARLEQYTGISFKELQPVVRRLSNLLKTKPIQADVLQDFFPTWAKQEWM